MEECRQRGTREGKDEIDEREQFFIEEISDNFFKPGNEYYDTIREYVHDHQPELDRDPEKQLQAIKDIYYSMNKRPDIWDYAKNDILEEEEVDDPQEMVYEF